MKTRAGRGVTLTLSYLALALVMTYPLILHFGSYAMAGLEDGSMSIWNLWWMKFSLFQLGQSPLHTSYLFFPDGSSLVFHSLPKALGFFSIPLQYLGGITVAYNIIFLLTFVATALTTYWLVYYLLGERLPAFLAGAFFAFSPFRWDQQAHLQLLSTMLIPVYILMVIKGREALKKGGRRPWVYFSLAGLALAVTAYDTEYYAIFLILFSALYAIFYFPFRFEPAALRRWGLLVLGLGLAGAILAVLFLPILLAARNELAAQGDYVTFPANWTARYARDLLSFFIPQQRAQYLGSAFAAFTGNRDLDTTFLGWLAMTLALGGIWVFRRRRDVWFWTVAAAGFALLALGPDLTIHRRIITHYGPFLILNKIPVLSAVRVPSRLAVMTMLAVAILAAYGASALFGYLRKLKWANVALPVATALILLAIVIEYQPWVQMISTHEPPVYSEIAASGVSGSVITLPLGWEAGAVTTGTERTFTELYQFEHQQPMVGGMLARTPKDRLLRGIYTPVMDFLADPVQLVPSDLDRDPEAIARFMDRYQVAYIVAQKKTPEAYFEGEFVNFTPNLTPEALERVDKYVTDYLGMEKFAETDEIVAYRLR